MPYESKMQSEIIGAGNNDVTMISMSAEDKAFAIAACIYHAMKKINIGSTNI